MAAKAAHANGSLAWRLWRRLISYGVSAISMKMANIMQRNQWRHDSLLSGNV